MSCYGCTKRKVGCHSGCEEYERWRKEYQKEKEPERREKRIKSIERGYMNDRYRRLTKRKD